MASKLFVDELEPTESSELTITSLSKSSMPTGSVIRKTYYSIGRGTYANSLFPNDDTIPQRSEGTEIFSQA